MAVTIELPADVLARLEAEAARRGVSVEELITESAARSVAALPESEPPRKSALAQTGSRLSISGVGASGGRKGWARDADEILAEGFGRD